MAVNEPVLVMAFNRPDLLERVLDRLRMVDARSIYIAIDGPRAEKSHEAEAVEACRALARGVEWTPDVRTHFRDGNLGCGRGVSDNITWFFSQVERGIILEDDVVPDPSFFPYCTTLLDRYQDDERVFAISGANHVPQTAMTWPHEPYRFAEFTHVWGWATWRRSWAKHEVDCRDWRKKIPLHTLIKRSHYSARETLYWATNWELTGRGAVDTWDYQLALAALAEGSLVATSNVNLVQNIGFGEGATHTHGGDPGLMPVEPMRFPIDDVQVRLDRKAAAWTMKYHCQATVIGALDRLRNYWQQRRRS